MILLILIHEALIEYIGILYKYQVCNVNNMNSVNLKGESYMYNTNEKNNL